MYAADYESEALMAEKDIWLPKDEREMLAFYYRDLEIIGNFKKYKNNSKRVLHANRNLEARHMIEFDEYKDLTHVIISGLSNIETDLANFLTDTKVDTGRRGTVVKLTLNGWDLGRKYAHWILRSQRWFMQYGRHWILLGLGWIISLIAMGLVTWWISRAQ